ncbi:MAG: sigma 54-interacting transcriptional regulator [Planctomycetes bacterium]|nr:sigma 54-interacting transcriptional regulator [Planctomycetota bacterium]
MRRESKPRRLSAEEVAIILDSVADGVFTVDRDLVITSFNRAAEEITGFTADEAIGERCYNVFRSSVCQGGCLLAESIRTGLNRSGLEVNILNRKNEEVPISVSTAVLRGRDGELLGGVETFRDLSAVEQLRRETRRRYTLGDLVSKNHRMQAVFALVDDVAASTAAVLIEGETGTGKGLLARAIHDRSARCERPFIAVNCGSLPDTLLESELFGHVAGAFTDARQARQGRFELADGGTLFLDEIGDMSLAMQVKLLRVLQDGTFEPVGASQARRVDVRILAATHRDLKERVGRERFREDLYYRINTVRLRLPPLRERPEDIPLLVDHFVARFNELTGRGLTGRRVSGVSPQAMRALLRYRWPGNVRELEHAIEHAFVLVKDRTIGLQHLPVEISGKVPVESDESEGGGAGGSVLDDAERRVIEEVLAKHGGNRAAAGRELGVSRTTLWRKMRRLGIRLR